MNHTYFLSLEISNLSKEQRDRILIVLNTIEREDRDNDINLLIEND